MSIKSKSLIIGVMFASLIGLVGLSNPAQSLSFTASDQTSNVVTEESLLSGFLQETADHGIPLDYFDIEDARVSIENEAVFVPVRLVQEQMELLADVWDGTESAAVLGLIYAQTPGEFVDQEVGVGLTPVFVKNRIAVSSSKDHDASQNLIAAREVTAYAECGAGIEFTPFPVPTIGCSVGVEFPIPLPELPDGDPSGDCSTLDIVECFFGGLTPELSP